MDPPGERYNPSVYGWAWVEVVSPPKPLANLFYVVMEKDQNFLENPFHFLLLTETSRFGKYSINSKGYDNRQGLVLKMLLDKYRLQ